MMDRRVRKQNEFIERARAIHGDKYDYSQVVYRTCKDKVRIVCPIHGVFEQTPEHHAYCGHGCLKCRPAKVKETVRSRYGVDYVSQSAGFRQRWRRRIYGSMAFVGPCRARIFVVSP